jgi:hypothetical protein
VSMSRIVRSTDRAHAGPRVARTAHADARRSAQAATVNDVRTDIRFNLALRLDGIEREQPAALDLLADVHGAIHAELHGRASALCGAYTERNWRDVLVGVRDLRMKDVCRLAVGPHPWARAAVVAALRVLARGLGYDIVPLSAAPVDPHDVIGDISMAAAAVVAELAEGVKDGRLDAQEVADLEPDVARLDQVRAALGATMAQARRVEVVRA